MNTHSHKWLPCLLLLAGLCCGMPSAHGDTLLLRSTLIVSDLDRSLSWYRMLGFTVEQELGGSRNPDAPFPLASRSTGFRLLILAPADGRGGRLGLLQFRDPPPPVVHPPVAQVGVGSVVLVVEADDAQALFAALQAQGADLVSDVPAELRRVSADGQEGIGYVFHARDPDGMLVEIFQPPFASR